MSDPHVLVLPSWYPTHYSPMRGSFFLEQARALQQAGLQVGVIYPDFRSYRTLKDGALFATHFQLSKQIEDGLPSVRFDGWNPISARLRGRMFLSLTKRLWKAYVDRWGRPDIIHAHSALWGGAAARELAYKTGIPYVITEHSSAYARGLIRPWQRDILSKAFSQTAALITVSQSLAQSLEPFLESKHAPIKIIPNMVDTAFFTLNPALHSEGPFRFLVVAFLTANKGIDCLLRAFARAFNDAPDVILEIGGDGPERRPLESLVDALSLRDRVRFLGSLSREAVREAMWRANAFVLPSYVETFGVVLIEAMATGLPVIATRSGGPEEIITPRTGALVAPGDESALAQALVDMRNNRDRFLPGDQIRKEIVTKFSQQAVIGQLLAVYHDILRGIDEFD